MFYKLLGMLVWNGGKFFLRQKYGRTHAPKPLVAGGVVAVAVGIALAIVAARQRD